MKQLIALLLAAILLMACIGALSENDKEMENYTRYTDYDPQPAEPIGLIPGSDHTTLVVWFSRVGNTVFDPDVDVVSSATLNRDENGELIGNAQLTARWIAEETVRMYSRSRRLIPIHRTVIRRSRWAKGKILIL